MSEILDSLKATETDEITLTLTSLEWTAVGTLLSLAVEAGCPSEAARSARDKIIAIHKRRIADEWPENVQYD